MSDLLISLPVTVDIGLGGLGAPAAALVHRDRVEDLVGRLRVPDSERASVVEAVESLTPLLGIDSDSFNAITYAPLFPSRQAVRAEQPARYVRLGTSSGPAIAASLDAPNHRHLRRWGAKAVIGGMKAKAEAQGVRAFGELLLLLNTARVARHLGQVVSSLASAASSTARLTLARHGLLIDDGHARANVFFSTAGGQGSGALLPTLALLHRAIGGAREDFLVRVVLTTPGFHPPASRREAENQQKKLVAVLRDLALLRAGDATLHVPMPGGDGENDIVLTPPESARLFDEVFVFEPQGGDDNALPALLTRISRTMTAIDCSALSQDYRRNAGNADAHEA